ncbi:MAG: hypothetical protein AB1716_07160 [Planctomycetota bacterium]
MTRRERVLALCLGGALAGTALATLVKYTIVAPFYDVQDEINREHTRRVELQKLLVERNDAERRWQAQTRRTLSLDEQEAQRVFRADMHQLLERYQLREPRVSPGTIATDSKTRLVSVPVRISATGTLEQIVQFLCDFYARDYFARLEKVDVTADIGVIANSAGTKAGAARAGKPAPAGRAGQSSSPQNPELKLDLTAVTLVLPKQKDSPHPVLEDPTASELAQRLSRERAAYNVIYENSPFRPWEPEPVKPPAPPPAAHATTRLTPPPVVDTRKDADKFFVRICGQVEGEPVTWIDDTRPEGEGFMMKFLDEDLDDGVLILIHTDGLVVRVTPPNGGAIQDYFYPLGSSYKDRVLLTADQYPEIARTVAECAGELE